MAARDRRGTDRPADGARSEKAGTPNGDDGGPVQDTAPGADTSTESGTPPGAATSTGSDTPTGPGSGDRVTVGWDELPEGARVAVITLAARTLGSVPADQLPATLTAVARFTPGKRARRGATPLARALQRDASFRALVAQHLGELPPTARDPTAQAARAFLLQLPGSDEVITAAARVDEVAALRAQVTDLTAALERLTGRLAEASSTAAGTHQKQAAEGAGRAEADRLRQRLREQGTRLKRLQEESREAVMRAERDRDRALAAADQERASADRWHSRAEQEAHRAAVAQQAADRWRDRAGRARADADRRIDLLLQTIERAAGGLRREWQLVAGGSDPADVIARDLPSVTDPARRSVDAPLLLDWVSLPGAHLIVDGYNVTKTGYPELSLADQRDRLARSLAVLAARTGAEITVVFDGAAVVAPPPPSRGVRVMFSPPGVIADDVIRDLAAAEPAGRVVIVVSSDREVVDGVRRSGARTAPSAVLLTALG